MPFVQFFFSGKGAVGAVMSLKHCIIIDSRLDYSKDSNVCKPLGWMCNTGPIRAQ